jgi:(p)ppGpp synthase/HD superfamily hydrolase
MKYHIRVYDNYHYADESEAYNHKTYVTYEEAEQAAKEIVNEFLEHNWSRGTKPDILVAQYCLYGEDPTIFPKENPDGKHFSGRKYAEESAKIICQKLEDEQKNMEVQTVYQEAIKFASRKHQEKRQKVKGTRLPYVVHLSNVAMEIMIAALQTNNFILLFAVQVALLHDTIEDTDTTFEELKEEFGKDVANAVLALSKDKKLPKEEQLIDTINRIKKQPKEVWSVKLADRITNLQPAPKSWKIKKKKQYVQDAKYILDELGEGNEYLAKRLEAKISEYRNQSKEYLLDGM